jgi:hypothetical protein
MLREFKEKEFNRINTMIESYQNDINDLTVQAAAVDEKYRKLAEEEKKNLNEALDYYKDLQSELISRRDALGLEAAVVDKKTQKAKLKEAEEQEVVKDTLFPENNSVEPDEPAKEEEPVMEEPEPEPIEEEKVEEVVEETTEVEDVWPDDDAEVSEEAAAQEEDEDEGWPDVVEEWK